MNCPTCRQENPSGANFCNHCGMALAAGCPSCGHPNQPGSRFCSNCGHAFAEAAEPTSPPSSSGQPPRSHPPDEPPAPPGLPRGPVAAPSGERRHATVLFSDLSGYTTMNERLDPEEVQGIMGRIKGGAVRIVEAHGGIVNQFVGDEVFALFGVPSAHEDDPVRAVRAALELHALAREVGAEVEPRLGRSLRMHTGINSGLVVTSTRDAREGTVGVTGDAVNIAARLRALAVEDEILLSPDTQRRVEPFFSLEALSPVELKGKGEVVIPYRVTGASRVETRIDAAEQRGFTSFTGREHELQLLASCMEEARAGRGRFVTVAGEAGVGKSRLLYQFRDRLEREQVNVLQGRCQSFGTSTPYFPLLDALRRGLALREEDSAEKLLEKAVTNLLAINPCLRDSLPFLLHLLSIPSAEYPLPGELQGEELRRAIQETLAELVTISAQVRPILLILEDWHWADEASDAALRYLLGRLPEHPLMIVVNHRPDLAANWGEPEGHTPIMLGPLDAANGERIVRSVLEVGGLPAGFSELIHERTGGNPLFIEEICSNLLEEGLLRVTDGKAALAGSSDQLSLPETVQAVIRSRLDRLGEPHREILRVASVIGREFPLRLVERATGAGDPAPLLEELQNQNLIQQVRIVPEVAYAFKHTLTQVVVYETMLLRERRALHGVVGEAIEVMHGERLTEMVGTLAYHYGRSEETEKALHYLMFAGNMAATTFSLIEAREHYWEALALLDAGEKTPETMAARIDANLKLSAVSFYAPSSGQIGILETSLDYARKLDDGARELRTLRSLGLMHFVLGSCREAMPLFEQCMDMAQQAGSRNLAALFHNLIGRASMILGNFREARERLENGIPMMEALGNSSEVAISSGWLGLTEGWSGNFGAYAKTMKKSLHLSKETGNLDFESTAHFFAGAVENLYGNWEQSVAVSTKCITISARTGNVINNGLGTSFIGYATFMLGEPARGIRLMREGIARVESIGPCIGISVSYAWMAELYALIGDVGQAQAFGERALERVRIGESFAEQVAERAMALAHAADGAEGVQKAEAAFADSLRHAEEKGALPDLAVGQFRYAEWLAQTGASGEAARQAKQAEEMFGALHMSSFAARNDELLQRLA